MRSPVSTDRLKADFKRFFVTLPEPVEQFPLEVTLNDHAVSHHLRNVVRARPGEQVVIVDDAREIAYEATIRELYKATLVLTVEGIVETAASPLPHATLAVSLIKEQRWDWLLQKATELGARAFQPLMADRSVIRLSEADIPRKLERWGAVLRSAAEQSEGLFVPQILPPLTVAEFCGHQSVGGKSCFVLVERGENRLPFKKVLPTLEPGKPACFAIGPEGGWTETEREAFASAGFQAVSFGSRILRSETAAVAAMGALVYEFGEGGRR